jgi:NAD(P)-dependent dehydrogenase (short-subunit alcohol dehydrogenase family)
VCPHGPDDGCGCRKPAPGLVLAAAAALGVDPSECVVIGDIGSDIEAARSAGARGILVPTDVTRPEEVADAPEVAESLEAAVDLLVGEIGTVDLLVGEGGTVDLLVGEGGTVDLLVGEIGTVDLLVGRDGKDGTVDRLVGGR